MPTVVDQLLRGERSFLCFSEQEERADLFDFSRSVLLPGSFNPLHKGHLQLVANAEKMSGRMGLLELSVTNVDKPMLEKTELIRRLDGMKAYPRKVVTRAATFKAKAELFPGACFVLGFDTAARLLSPSYHADIPSMLERFTELKVYFLVGGRLQGDRFMTLDALDVPLAYRSLFKAIPPESFRQDISSTAIRERQ